MKTPCRAVLIIPFIFAVFACADGATFQGLGLGPEANSYQSYANAVSADGSAVAGFYSVISGGSHSFRWTACTGMMRLYGHAGVAQDPTNAYDVSGNGSVVVGGNDSGSFRWTEGGGVTFLGLAGPASATVVSDDGTVILGYGRLNGPFSPQQGWIKIGTGQITPFSFSDFLAIFAISRDNSIVVGGGGPALRWTAATGEVELPDLDPGSPSSVGWDISADGKVIVGTSVSADKQVHLVNWTGPNNTISNLGVLASRDGVGASADATNADGSIIVGEAVATVGTQNTAYAMIWDATNGIRNLQDVLTNDYGLGSELSGWQLTDATGISDDGKVIAGNGIYTDSTLNEYNEAWVVTLYSSPTLTCGGSNAFFSGAPHTVSLPLSGAPGIECRSSDGTGGSNHTFVFGFTSAISGTPTVNATCGNVISSGPDPNNPNFYLVTVDATGCNQQYVTVSLTGLQSAQRQRFALDQTVPSVSVTAGLLLGDVDGSGRVDGNDVSAVQAHTRQALDGTTFRFDLDGNGRIDGNDVSTAQSHTRSALPP